VSAEADIPPPPWEAQRKATRARREGITREAIVDAAFAVLERDGADALSMRRVADELGTGAASLYWHFAGKDELIDAVIEQAIGEFVVPDADPERWEEQLREVAHDFRASLQRRPYLVKLSLGRWPLGPNALKLTDRVMGILRAGGLPNDMVAMGTWLLTIVVNAFAYEEISNEERQGEGPSPPEIAEMVSSYFGSLPPERFPNLVAMKDEFASGDPDLPFGLLVDLFVDGLAQRAKR
jgi:TetR/AcrR family transcriptional regulator, tetracycline repressor protein